MPPKIPEPKVPLELLVCNHCGNKWVRPRLRGPKPVFCPDCVTPRIPVQEQRERRQEERRAQDRRTDEDRRSFEERRRAFTANRLDVSSPGYLLSAKVAAYLGAINHAYRALRLGHYAEAEAALAAVIPTVPR